MRSVVRLTHFKVRDWRRDPFHVNRSRERLKLQNEAILTIQNRLVSPEAHLDDGLLVAITHLMISDVSVVPEQKVALMYTCSRVGEILHH
jgi:hypothetical protein